MVRRISFQNFPGFMRWYSGLLFFLASSFVVRFITCQIFPRCIYGELGLVFYLQVLSENFYVSDFPRVYAEGARS